MKKETIKKLNAYAMGNTLGLIVLILHPLFHLWTFLSPESYQFIVRMFFPGFIVTITPFDFSTTIILFATILKSAVFWLLGFIGALLYNKFAAK